MAKVSLIRGKNILVTGGAGFLGANMVKRLLELGANVRATIHKKDAVIVDDHIEYLGCCDLQYASACDIVCDGMDYVIHCAAVSHGAAVTEKTPLVYLTPNIVMNAQMLDAAYKAKVKKFVFISSNGVYPLTDYPVREEDQHFEFYEKYEIVGWMKRYTEIMCEQYATKIPNPMTTIVLRPANMYGPLDDFRWETSHVLPAMIRRVVERHDPIEVWGDGSSIKDFIYVDDFIDGAISALEKIEDFDIFNIASGKSVQLRRCLELIAYLDGYINPTMIYDASKPVMIPTRLIDVTKAREMLDFEAKTDMGKGLRKTIDWYHSARG